MFTSTFKKKLIQALLTLFVMTLVFLGTVLVFLELTPDAWSGVREDFAAYETSEGFLTGHLHPTAPDGNSLLFSAEKLFALDFLGELEPQDAIQFTKLLRLCEIEPGRYRRTPLGEAFSQDQEAQDDYIGILAASKLLGLNTAEEIREYGETHKYPVKFGFSLPFYYSINENKQDVNAWLGRYPGFVLELNAATDDLSLFERLGWSSLIWASGRWDAPDQDPWILTWLMLATTGEVNSYVARDWRLRLRNAWPSGGLGEIFGRYFNDPNHPLAKWMWRAGFDNGVQ